MSETSTHYNRYRPLQRCKISAEAVIAHVVTSGRTLEAFFAVLNTLLEHESVHTEDMTPAATEAVLRLVEATHIFGGKQLSLAELAGLVTDINNPKSWGHEYVYWDEDEIEMVQRGVKTAMYLLAPVITWTDTDPRRGVHEAVGSLVGLLHRTPHILLDALELLNSAGIDGLAQLAVAAWNRLDCPMPDLIALHIAASGHSGAAAQELWALAQTIRLRHVEPLDDPPAAP